MPTFVFHITVIFLMTSVASCFSSIVGFPHRTDPSSMPNSNCTAALTLLDFYDSCPSYNMPCQCTHKAAEIKANNFIWCTCVRFENKSDVDFSLSDQQHSLNAQWKYCQYRGHTYDNVQLPLTDTAKVFLDKATQSDEKLRHEQTAFLALQIAGGHIGLPILILHSLLSRETHRDLTFLNFCFTWAVSSVIFSIGLYSGRTASTFAVFAQTIPAFSLSLVASQNEPCRIQAVLITSVQIITATAMLGLIIQLWLNLHVFSYGSYTLRQRRWAAIALVVTPYIMFVGAFILSYLIVSFRGHIEKKCLIFYCMLGQESLFISAMYGMVLVIQVVTLVFDVFVLRILYRHWRFFRLRQSNAKGNGNISLSLVLRVLTFSVYRILVAVGYGAVLVKHTGVITRYRRAVGLNPVGVIPVWVDMLQATVPLVAFLVFGTNKKFLNMLLFWRKTSTKEQTTTQTVKDGA